MNKLDVVFIILFVIWFMSELWLLSNKKKNEISGVENLNPMRRSLIILFIIFLAFFVGIYSKLNNISLLYKPVSFIPYLSIALIILGACIRLLSIATLNKYFTINLTILDEHKIIQSGLYKYIRHPSYLGALMVFFGAGLFYCNWLSFILIFFPYAITILRRINDEEKMLKNHFGNFYLEYEEKTKKIIPFIY